MLCWFLLALPSSPHCKTGPSGRQPDPAPSPHIARQWKSQWGQQPTSIFRNSVGSTALQSSGGSKAEAEATTATVILTVIFGTCNGVSSAPQMLCQPAKSEHGFTWISDLCRYSDGHEDDTYRLGWAPNPRTGVCRTGYRCGETGGVKAETGGSWPDSMEHQGWAATTRC